VAADSGPVLFERQSGVAYLTLNRPDAGNAIDVSLAEALLGAVVAAETDPAVRCVVLRSAGRMFCAGGDVKGLHAAGEALPVLLDAILAHRHPAVSRLSGMAKPVITAIHGPAAGAGMALAAVGDIALATPNAHFTMAYSRIGLSPDAGATWLLPRLIGLRRAQELALTNRRISADEAAAMGLITRVVPADALGQEVAALAESLASSATGALGRTKRLLLAGNGATLEQQLEAECANIVDQSRSAECRAGFTAFTARYEPDFTKEI
jgi:2-(1,2-epoxy-1,2-dihydrophenyl)acetyl-CoA isomerase